MGNKQTSTGSKTMAIEPTTGQSTEPTKAKMTKATTINNVNSLIKMYEAMNVNQPEVGKEEEAQEDVACTSVMLVASISLKFELLRDPATRAASTLPSSTRRTLTLLGPTGVGKSYLTTEIVGESVVGQKIVSNSTDSATTKCTVYEGKEISVMDTPGFADTQHRTLEFFEDITTSVNQTTDAVPVVCVSFQQRFTLEFLMCLKAIALMMDLGVNEYLLIINRVQVGRRDTFTAESKCQEITERIATEIGHAPKHCLPVGYDVDVDSEQLARWASGMKPVDNCMSFEDLQRTLDSMKSEVADIQKRLSKSGFMGRLRRMQKRYHEEWATLTNSKNSKTDRAFAALGVFVPITFIFKMTMDMGDELNERPTPEELKRAKELKQYIEHTCQMMQEVQQYFQTK